MIEAQKQLLLKTLSNIKHELTLEEFSVLMSAYKSLYEMTIPSEVPMKQVTQEPVKKVTKKTKKKTSKAVK